MPGCAGAWCKSRDGNPTMSLNLPVAEITDIVDLTDTVPYLGDPPPMR